MAIQEAQLASSTPPSISGYQVAAVARRARGRRAGGPVKGGGAIIFVRDGLAFKTNEQSPLHSRDDSAEWCAVRLFLVKSSSQPSSTNSTSIDVFNVFRPPIRAAADDDGLDRFEMAAFPTSPDVIIAGDFNACLLVNPDSCSSTPISTSATCPARKGVFAA